MTRCEVKALLPLAAWLLLPTAGDAQTTGRIEGRIADATGGALPGALLSVESPQLQGTRGTTSDDGGRYHFPALPPGAYTLRCELAGLKPVRVDGLRVGLDRTVSLDLEMIATLPDEVLTVTVETAPIDLTSTTIGSAFDSSLIEALPVARKFQDLMFKTPGVVSGGLRDNPSVSGASAAENRYLVDGLDTTNPAFGIAGTSLPFEFIEEVEVKTGGYQAEYGGALGGIANVLTKSGGNQLHGDVFGYFTGDGIQATTPSTERYGRDLGFRRFDLGADVAGRILRDELWFFAAVNPILEDHVYSTRQDLSFTARERIPLLFSKLTWQARPKHRFVASVLGEPTSDDGFMARNAAGLLGSDLDLGRWNASASYNGILAPNLLLEAAVGRSTTRVNLRPLVEEPFYSDYAGGAFAAAAGCGDPSLVAEDGVVFTPDCRGGFTFRDAHDSRNEARAALSLFGRTGALSHQLKLGGVYRRMRFADAIYGPQRDLSPFRDSTGALVDPDGLSSQGWLLFDSFAVLNEYEHDAAGTTDELALFAQDQLSLGRLTLNLGLRLESSQATGEKSAELPGRTLEFGLGDRVAPRLGFVLDVAGDGRSKLYGHYGGFYESIPLDLNVRAFSDEQLNFFSFYYADDGSLPTASNPGTYFGTFTQATGGTRVASGIKPQRSDDYVVGFEHRIGKGLSVGVQGVHRALKNVIEDVSVDGGQTYFITNPGGTFTANPATGEPLAEPVVFPRATRRYKALQLSVTRALANNWQLAASYVLSENRGNYGGLFRQDNGQLDPNLTSLFDLPELLEGAEGLLPNDRTHQFKAYGSYRWPFKLTTGFYLEVSSGTPLSKLGGHPTYGPLERFVTPRGSAGRGPGQYQLDLHLDYPLRVAGKADLRLIADVFNAANRKAGTLIDQQWTFAAATRTTDPGECGGADPSCPDGNPGYGKPIEYQSARSLRLGVRVSW